MSQAPEITWQQAIGRLFTTRREKLGLRIHDVAFEVSVAGVPVTADITGRIMRGEIKNPSPLHLGAIADVLGVDQAEWMGVAMANVERPEGGTSRTRCIGGMPSDHGFIGVWTGTERTLAAAA